MAKADIHMVTTAFVITLEDQPVEYRVGELVDADDPALKIVPQHFGPPEFKHRAAKPVEHGTGGKAVSLASMRGQ